MKNISSVNTAQPNCEICPRRHHLPICKPCVFHRARGPRWWSRADTWVRAWGWPPFVCPQHCTGGKRGKRERERRGGEKKKLRGATWDGRGKQSEENLRFLALSPPLISAALHTVPIIRLTNKRQGGGGGGGARGFLRANLHFNQKYFAGPMEALTTSSCGGRWRRPAPATAPCWTSGTPRPRPPVGGRRGATSEPMASKVKKNKYIQWFNVRPHPLGVLHLGRIVGQHFRRFPGREKLNIKN